MNGHGLTSKIRLGAALAVVGLVVSGAHAEPGERPNFIIILFDDLGYGDLGCYGDDRLAIATPNIDRVAAEGIRLTDFYVAANICAPSRAALMTGRYPQRCGVAFGVRPLPYDEITVAQILKRAGYTNACLGKWHLGDAPPHGPTYQGFDYYYGSPGNGEPWVPMMENQRIVEPYADRRDLLTAQYTEKSVEFIRRHQDKPFFLYYANHHPHDPQAASERFRGKSKAGLYGDVVEELDWSVGEIMRTLKELDLDERTLVVITSDNGADYFYREGEGSNGPLRGGKCTTEEGGHRVPAIFRWPGRIQAGRLCRALATSMDILPTFSRLAGASVPDDRVLDGKDIWPLLTGTDTRSPHKVFYYYNGTNLQAVRVSKWKLHLPRTPDRVPFWQTVQGMNTLERSLLYNLDADIGEKLDLSKQYPDVVRRLEHLADEARAELGEGDDPGRDRKRLRRARWDDKKTAWEPAFEDAGRLWPAWR